MTDPGAALEELRRMGSLAEASEAALEWLAEHVRPETFASGASFIREGDTERDCFFIVSGETRVVRGESLLGTTGPGEPEGEVALFLEIPRTATTTAVTEVRVLRLPAERFDALRSADPALAEHLRTTLCRHLARRFGLRSFLGVPSDN